MTVQGILLLAHGSRDPLWRRPIEAVQAEIQTRYPQHQVRCAYLELCPPTLEQAVDQLAALGLQRIAIVPLFLGAGRHVREQLPQTIRHLSHTRPRLTLTLAAPIGEHPRMVTLMAELASSNLIDD